MKFGYTILYVPQLEPTIRFYEAAFGFERGMVDESGYGELKTGATTLSFATLEFARANGLVIGATRGEESPPAEVAFVTDDVAGAVERAVAAGAVMVAPPQVKPWGQTVAYVRDFNGFLVELCTPVGE